MNRPNAKTLVRAATWLILVTIAVVATLWTVPTTFNVTADTEHIRFTTQDGPNPRWVLRGVKLLHDYNPKSEPFDGSLSLEPNVEVVMQRIGSGALRIRGRAQTQTASAGTLFDDADRPLRALGSRFVVTVETFVSGQTIKIPMAGQVDLGKEAGLRAGADEGMLRSGKVSLLGRSLIGGNSYDAGSVVLDQGDRFWVSHPAGAAYGLVIADEEPALRVVYRVVGDKGIVSRFGSSGYSVSTSLRARLINDSSLTGVWFTVLALMGIAKVVVNPKRGES